MSFIFNAPFLLILYFLDFLNSLLSLVHVICALEKQSTVRPILGRPIVIVLHENDLLVEFSNGAANLDGRCALKHLRDTTNFQVHLRVQVSLIIRGVLTGNNRQRARIHVVASPGVTGFLRGRLLRSAFAVLVDLVPPLGHYLLADHFAPFHASPTGFRALKNVQHSFFHVCIINFITSIVLM